MLLKVGNIKRGKNTGDPVAIDIHWAFDNVMYNTNSDLSSFNAFDKSVILACISEYVTHNQDKLSSSYITTIDRIYRAMIGDSDDSKRKKLTDKMKKEMLSIINKARLCDLQINLTDSCLHYGYNNSQPLELHDYLLPCRYIDGYVVNGKPTTILEFTNVSPLFIAAKIQNGQILTYDKKFLAVPGVKNDKDNIVLRDYFLRRVLEIKAHNLEKTIVFDTAFEQTGLTKITRDKKHNLLKNVEKYFSYWLKINLIASMNKFN